MDRGIEEGERLGAKPGNAVELEQFGDRHEFLDREIDGRLIAA